MAGPPIVALYSDYRVAAGVRDIKVLRVRSGGCEQGREGDSPTGEGEPAEAHRGQAGEEAQTIRMSNG